MDGSATRLCTRGQGAYTEAEWKTQVGELEIHEEEMSRLMQQAYSEREKLVLEDGAYGFGMMQKIG